MESLARPGRVDLQATVSVEDGAPTGIGAFEHALRAQQLRDAAPAVRAWPGWTAHDADAEELADIFGEDLA
ncbi:hypothetical protein [Streptomyces silvisoli]|uniref:Uncharacterized protein n=1 Tax=Streptomyces silvisoli TaxID=3034235 RepID=A0ABT5ZT30_9ACTN|nr:hypothetical protein [Streptomyces silvisoli]MDF3292992.1 hypothetical protein [Streptomyces silvisoli]